MPFSAPTPRWKNGFAGWRRWRIEGNFEHIRSTAIRIIEEVEGGGFLDESIERRFSRLSFSEQQKAITYQISSGVIRRKAYLEWLLSHFISREVKKDLRYLLWTALFQALFMKKTFYHVVNEAVDYAKKHHGKPAANFVNAVLRRSLAQRERLELPGDPVLRMATEFSFPPWMVGRWLSRFGEKDTRRLLTLLDTEPEFCLRIDVERISREAVASRLEQKGVQTREGALLPSALFVNKLSPVLNDRLFKEGLLRVQDESSQLAGIVVGPQPGMLIADVAAEPGTKTEHLLQLCPGARITAMDLHVNRLAVLSSRVLLVRGDAVKNPFKNQVFDSILLDAPCSSLGVIRKHPEIKWRRYEADIARFSSYQLNMIEGLWENLKPGGHFIYSVCSFEPEETTQVIEELKRNKKFSEAPLPLQTGRPYHISLPHLSGSDGFFIAKLKKQE